MRQSALFLALILTSISVPALAGPNEGGVLLLHVNESAIWSMGDEYCGLSGIEICESADVRVDRIGYSIFHLFAAFPPDSSPRLLGMTVGIDYDPGVVAVEQWQTCSDFELPTTDGPPHWSAWPLPNSGNALTWDEIQTGHLVEAGWFAAYCYSDAPTLFSTVPSPVAGSVFADDSVPSILDEVADFGALGFHTEGYLPCPPGPAIGACCFDEVCELRTEEACGTEGGVWEGSGGCEPNPCHVTPTISTTWGRIKNSYR